MAKRTSADDQTKQKFREALERKKNRAQSGEPHEDQGSKTREPSSAKPNTLFRRKTG